MSVFLRGFKKIKRGIRFYYTKNYALFPFRALIVLIRTLLLFFGCPVSDRVEPSGGEITHKTKDPLDLITDKLCQLCSELFSLILVL